MAPLLGGLPIRTAAAGDTLLTGEGGAASVLHPPRELDTDPNNASLCLLLDLPARTAWTSGWREGTRIPLAPRDGRVTVLLTGDLEDWGTSLLLAAGIRKADILLAPHHGAALASAEALAAAAAPQEVWVSARRGFPSPAALAGLASGGARVRESWRDGALLLEALP